MVGRLQVKAERLVALRAAMRSVADKERTDPRRPALGGHTPHGETRCYKTRCYKNRRERKNFVTWWKMPQIVGLGVHWLGPEAVGAAAGWWVWTRIRLSVSRFRRHERRREELQAYAELDVRLAPGGDGKQMTARVCRAMSDKSAFSTGSDAGRGYPGRRGRSGLRWRRAQGWMRRRSTRSRGGRPALRGSGVRNG